MAAPSKQPDAGSAGPASALHLVALSAFALAQPLYDLLGKNAEFFPIRGSGGVDIVGLTIGLSLLLPLALALLVAATRCFGKHAHWHSQNLAIALLVAIIVMPLFKELLAYSALVNMGCSLAIGAAFAFAYARRPAMRLFVTCVSPAILIFPLLFLFHSQVALLLFTPPPPVVEPPEISATTPVVMIVFDELPMATLMAGENLLDANLFPGFAELAQEATWYPNTTTVAEYTIQALPAILTGKLPATVGYRGPRKSLGGHWDLPTYAHHPHNLFTALGGSYQLRVFETVSSLCPPQRCAPVFDRDLGLERRLWDLVRDLSVVYLHIVLPRQMSRELPRMDMDWGDFLYRHEADVYSKIEDDDRYAFDLFVESLTAAGQPTLYFHHSGLPHGPWKYLPSGRRYPADSYSAALGATARWEDRADIREPFQRHLLQTMYADRLLQRAIAKLKAEQLYEQSIVVVTADHGASFLVGESFRIIDHHNYPEITDVPLFIKGAGQRHGRIDTTDMRTVDIIAALFQRLGEPYPWAIDGQVAGDSARRDDGKLQVVTREGEIKTVSYEADAKLAAVARKSRLVGSEGIGGVFAGPDHARIIGTRPEAGCGRLLNDSGLLANHDDFDDVRLASGYVPASLKIRWPGLGDGEALAVTLNDHIAALFQPAPMVDQNGYFFAMIDDRFFRSGKNRVEFYALNPAACAGEG